jgi:hypothetical protein
MTLQSIQVINSVEVTMCCIRFVEFVAMVMVFPVLCETCTTTINQDNQSNGDEMNELYVKFIPISMWLITLTMSFMTVLKYIKSICHTDKHKSYWMELFYIPNIIVRLYDFSFIFTDDSEYKWYLGIMGIVGLVHIVIYIIIGFIYLNIWCKARSEEYKKREDVKIKKRNRQLEDDVKKLKNELIQQQQANNALPIIDKAIDVIDSNTIDAIDSDTSVTIKCENN